ncbi:hypothetical protein VaNZ11_003672, partial [Volvox africanus]
ALGWAYAPGQPLQPGEQSAATAAAIRTVVATTTYRTASGLQPLAASLGCPPVDQDERTFTAALSSNASGSRATGSFCGSPGLDLSHLLLRTGPGVLRTLAASCGLLASSEGGSTSGESWHLKHGLASVSEGPGYSRCGGAVREAAGAGLEAAATAAAEAVAAATAVASRLASDGGYSGSPSWVKAHSEAIEAAHLGLQSWRARRRDNGSGIFVESTSRCGNPDSGSSSPGLGAEWSEASVPADTEYQPGVCERQMVSSRLLLNAAVDKTVVIGVRDDVTASSCARTDLSNLRHSGGSAGSLHAVSSHPPPVWSGPGCPGSQRFSSEEVISAVPADDALPIACHGGTGIAILTAAVPPVVASLEHPEAPRSWDLTTTAGYGPGSCSVGGSISSSDNRRMKCYYIEDSCDSELLLEPVKAFDLGQEEPGRGGSDVVEKGAGVMQQMCLELPVLAVSGAIGAEAAGAPKGNVQGGNWPVSSTTSWSSADWSQEGRLFHPTGTSPILQSQALQLPLPPPLGLPSPSPPSAPQPQPPQQQQLLIPPAHGIIQQLLEKQLRADAPNGDDRSHLDAIRRRSSDSGGVTEAAERKSSSIPLLLHAPGYSRIPPAPGLLSCHHEPIHQATDYNYRPQAGQRDRGTAQFLHGSPLKSNPTRPVRNGRSDRSSSEPGSASRGSDSNGGGDIGGGRRPVRLRAVWPCTKPACETAAESVADLLVTGPKAARAAAPPIGNKRPIAQGRRWEDTRQSATRVAFGSSTKARGASGRGGVRLTPRRAFALGQRQAQQRSGLQSPRPAPSPSSGKTAGRSGPASIMVAPIPPGVASALPGAATHGPVPCHSRTPPAGCGSRCLGVMDRPRDAAADTAEVNPSMAHSGIRTASDRPKKQEHGSSTSMYTLNQAAGGPATHGFCGQGTGTESELPATSFTLPGIQEQSRTGSSGSAAAEAAGHSCVVEGRLMELPSLTLLSDFWGTGQDDVANATSPCSDDDSFFSRYSGRMMGASARRSSGGPMATAAVAIPAQDFPPLATSWSLSSIGWARLQKDADKAVTSLLEQAPGHVPPYLHGTNPGEAGGSVISAGQPSDGSVTDSGSSRDAAPWTSECISSSSSSPERTTFCPRAKLAVGFGPTQRLGDSIDLHAAGPSALTGRDGADMDSWQIQPLPWAAANPRVVRGGSGAGAGAAFAHVDGYLVAADLDASGGTSAANCTTYITDQTPPRSLPPPRDLRPATNGHVAGIAAGGEVEVDLSVSASSVITPATGGLLHLLDSVSSFSPLEAAPGAWGGSEVSFAPGTKGTGEGYDADGYDVLSSQRSDTLPTSNSLGFSPFATPRTPRSARCGAHLNIISRSPCGGAATPSGSSKTSTPRSRRRRRHGGGGIATVMCGVHSACGRVAAKALRETGKDQGRARWALEEEEEEDEGEEVTAPSHARHSLLGLGGTAQAISPSPLPAPLPPLSRHSSRSPPNDGGCDSSFGGPRAASDYLNNESDGDDHADGDEGSSNNAHNCCQPYNNNGGKLGIGLGQNRGIVHRRTGRWHEQV